MKLHCMSPPRRRWQPTVMLVSMGLLMSAAFSTQAERGVNAERILIGGVMDLEGRSKGLGRDMKKGILAAIDGQISHGREIEFLTLNDSYTPKKTIAATKAMAGKKPFVMIGNVGTPTAKVSLPILAEQHIPAVGFFSGAGLLRPGVGQVVNYRASYVQETAAVIDAALDNGINADEICAYVQNDAYGMAGIKGVRRALYGKPGSDAAVAGLKKILALKGENPPRNGIAPVGVYQRNTFTARNGYQSLKDWERLNDTQCKVVVTVGSYASIASFAGYSRYKGEDWIISAVSFTGADNFENALRDNKASDNIVMTQVVPLLDSMLPIVQQARYALGQDFGYVTLEGYIVGKMFLHLLNEIEGEPTRRAFMDVARGAEFDLGGLEMDFSDDNQASDLVVLTHLSATGWQRMRSDQWNR